MEHEFAMQKRRIEELERLIDSLVVTQKVSNPSFSKEGDRDAIMKKACEEAQRNERITLGTQRSTFLHLGEKKVKLIQENEHPLLQRQQPPSANMLTEA